jgi:ceramide synthetase
MAHPYTERLEDLQYLKGNFTFTPNYIDLIKGIWNTISWYYAPRMWNGYTFPHSLIDDFTRNFFFPLNQIYYIVYIAILITLIRYLFEKLICKPFVDWLELTPINKKKFPESAWKCLFYTCTWTFNFYLLNYRYNYFQQPYLIWDDWSSGMNVPFDIKLMYFVQCGFYLHSIYGTLYMDYKRKDFYAMLIHHILTMTLIFVSYATRHHKVGLLVLFCHDITDIWLELAKASHYLSSRKGNRECPRWETVANGCFVMFVLTWFLFRLYWYPLKVLYTTGVVTGYRAYSRGCGLYGFFNSLLWILLGLNIYWLIFILQLLFRVLTGTANGMQDTREDEDDEDEETTPKSTPMEASVNNNTGEKKKKK